MSEEFNWGELGGDWWHDTAARLHADERQIKFAATLQRGASQKEAAICGGYGRDGKDPNDPRDDGTRRSEGSRVAQTGKIRRLLAEAAAEISARGGTEQPAVITDEEAMQLLSKDARNADPLGRSRALDSIAKIKDRQEAEQRRTKEEAEDNPLVTLSLIASINPYLAQELGDKHLSGEWKPDPEQVKQILIVKKRLFKKLSAEFGETANGHSMNDTEANQQAAARSIDGSAKPIAEKQNGALVGAEA